MGFFSKSHEFTDDEYRRARERMVEYQLRARDVKNEAVLDIMRKVPRHEFISPDLRREAYDDGPLPIGCGQTVSQPYIVASMTEYLEPDKHKEVLEIGTGSGYQTAVLAELFMHVHTVEFFRELSQEAQRTLSRLGYTNITFHIGDGLLVPPPDVKFDAIIVTAAPDRFPSALPDRLKPGGRLILPVGDVIQDLKLVVKDDDDQVHFTTLYPVRFVPLRHRD
jgi:protein-L-isoaspartate(D-aspartate) O-methyltransferase